MRRLAAACLLAAVAAINKPHKNVKALTAREFEKQRRERSLATTKRAMAAEDLQDARAPGTLRLCVRAVFLCWAFLPATLTFWLAFFIGPFRRRLWYPLLTWCLGRAGACFVKWAQWSATRSDLFPVALCNSLAGLQAGAPAHSRRHTKKLVEDAVGCQIDDYFDSFERKPIASGSIAQVHRATRRGQVLAVKVRHPKVGTRLRLDVTLLAFGARCLEVFPPLRALRLSDTVAQFGDTLAQQSRLDHEAQELRGFRSRFRRWGDVDFPRPTLETPSVLIESFLPGELVVGIAKRARNFDDLKQGLDRKTGAYLVTRGEDLYLKMLLEDKVMHADLHPGNLLYDGEILVSLSILWGLNIRQSRAISVVDAGMVSPLTHSESDRFVGLIEAIGAADAKAAARNLRAFDPANQKNLSKEQVRAFDDEVKLLFREKCRGYGTGVDFGDVVRGLLELVRKHRVRIGAQYATLVINALCLDGMAGDLLPGYSVLDGARPLLSAHRWFVSRGIPVVGPFVFRRLCLPVAWRLKGLYDAVAVRQFL